MPQNKYIGTKETARLTGLSMQEIYDLIHKGSLAAHKAPKSGWRIPFQALADLGLIKEEEESTWKRFATKAKELDKELKERFG